jgi:hypothetical protein
MEEVAEIIQSCCATSLPATIMSPDMGIIVQGRFSGTSDETVTFEVFERLKSKLKPFSTAVITYFRDGRSCVFITVVYDYRQKSIGAPELVVKLPKQIARTETRQALRVPLVANSGLRVRINRGRTTYHPRPVDISLGGMSLEFDKGVDPNIPLGTAIEVELRLDGEVVKLAAEVRRRVDEQYGLYFPSNTGSVEDDEEGHAPPEYRNIVHSLFRKWMLVGG